MLHLVVVAGMLIAAFQAVRSARLMASVIWLVCASALLALLLYALGAHIIAVLELSIGAGLVSVLLVFAITVAGDERADARSVVPLPLAGALVALVMLLAAMLVMQPVAQPSASVSPIAEPPFAVIFWEQRGLDALAQVGLIFAGALGVLGLLAERMPGAKAATEAGAEQRASHEHESEETEETEKAEASALESPAHEEAPTVC